MVLLCNEMKERQSQRSIKTERVDGVGPVELTQEQCDVCMCL